MVLRRGTLRMIAGVYCRVPYDPCSMLAIYGSGIRIKKKKKSPSPTLPEEPENGLETFKIVGVVTCVYIFLLLIDRARSSCVAGVKAFCFH